MAVHLIAHNRLLKKHMARVSVLIADDDAATISNVRKNVPWEIQKWSDINHAKKNITSDMYALNMPVAAIKYFARRLTLILESNKNNAESIKELLLCVVDHAYRCHV